MKVSLIMAQTLDGFISRSSNEFVDWTGNADKRFFVRATKKAGVIIMGSRTYDTIGRPLPGRKNVVLTRNKSRISNDANLVFTSQEPQKILLDLKAEGYESVALIGGSEINSLFAKLNLINEVFITIAPRLFGIGLTLFNVSLDCNLQLVSSKTLEENYILLHYKVV
ncbi:MAG TPA: dihydrofolate reductase family protein [Desulfopila sp.]|nr:dihydrofolate reductase family protein [Desulfopila sp.]